VKLTRKSSRMDHTVSRRPQLALGAALVAVTMGIAAPAAAGSMSGEPSAHASEAEEHDATVAAANYLARSEGVAPGYSRDRVEDQQIIAEFVTLTWPDPDGAPDLWIEQEGEAQVLFVRTLDTNAREALSGLELSTQTAIRFVDEAPLREQLPDPNADSFARIAEQVIPGYEGMYVSVQDGSLNVLSSAPLGRQRSTHMLEALTGFDDVTIHSSTAEAPSFLLRGGAGTNNCTAGFTARRPSVGQRGFVGADHCGVNQTVWSTVGQTGTNRTAQRTARSDRRNADIAFFNIAADHTPVAEIFTDNSASRRAIRTGPARPLVGQTLCSRGRVSGWRCGQVSTVSHRPPNNICDNLLCNSSFIRVRTQSRQGDSGGPWVSGNSPVGIMTSIGTVNGVHYSTVSCLRFLPGASQIVH